MEREGRNKETRGEKEKKREKVKGIVLSDTLYGLKNKKNCLTIVTSIGS